MYYSRTTFAQLYAAINSPPKIFCLVVTWLDDSDATCISGLCLVLVCGASLTGNATRQIPFTNTYSWRWIVVFATRHTSVSMDYGVVMHSWDVQIA
jgi:hypothetical protein